MTRAERCYHCGDDLGTKSRPCAVHNPTAEGPMKPHNRPDRLVIDADGFGWRVWDDTDWWSMVPQNPDNEPIPEPLTWYVRLDDTEFVASVVERLDMLTMGEPSTISDAADILRRLLPDAATDGSDRQADR